MDNGAKHKFWDVVMFPVEPRRSLIAANLEIQQYKRQDLVSVLLNLTAELHRPCFTLMFNSHTGKILSTKGEKKSEFSAESSSLTITPVSVGLF